MTQGYNNSINTLKTIVFQRQQTQQSIIFDTSILINDEQIDINHLLAQNCPLQSHKVSIYDPHHNKFTNLNKILQQNHGKIPCLFFYPQIILIRYKRHQMTEQKESESLDSSIEIDKDDKKDRSKERTIGQSINLVKQWRNIHINSGGNGMKKINLQEAAKAIGVSKKSLDDYYYQLRLGQFYGYDFNNNLNQKIGVLRKFVKQYRTDKDENTKFIRHPRNLKIIQQFEAQPNQNSHNIIKREEKLAKSESIDIVEQKIEENNLFSLQSPLSSHRLINFQEKYFKYFQYDLDEPIDPFLEVEKDFRKKPFEDNQDQFYFL